MDIFSKELLYTNVDKDFIRPNLTSNGTIGGNDFGVYANVEATNAYKAVDGNTSTYWNTMNYSTPLYRFYNPKPIKITSLKIVCSAQTFMPSSVIIRGNDDNVSTYEDLGGTKTSLGNTYTIDLSTNTKYYTYYQLALTPKSVPTRISELIIEAKEK